MYVIVGLLQLILAPASVAHAQLQVQPSGQGKGVQRFHRVFLNLQAMHQFVAGVKPAAAPGAFVLRLLRQVAVGQQVRPLQSLEDAPARGDGPGPGA